MRTGENRHRTYNAIRAGLLSAILASVPRTNLTFLMTEKGAHFTAAGFGNWFREQCNAAGLQHCSFHGLRGKAAATRLANAGCSTFQLISTSVHFFWRGSPLHARCGPTPAG